MAKLTAPFGLPLGAAMWLLLFVILGTGLGTAFIAGGVVAGAGLIAAAMLAAGPTLDAPPERDRAAPRRGDLPHPPRRAFRANLDRHRQRPGSDWAVRDRRCRGPADEAVRWFGRRTHAPFRTVARHEESQWA